MLTPEGTIRIEKDERWEKYCMFCDNNIPPNGIAAALALELATLACVNYFYISNLA